MNDITALAQRMKQQATLANGFLYVETSNILALVEALEKAQQPAEPFGFTDGDAHGMVYEPRHADRLANPCPVYRLPPLESKSRTVTVKLPEEAVDQVCLAAAEIHNRGNGVSDDKAQFIINRIRNYLENGGELTAAGIQVIEGEQKNG